MNIIDKICALTAPEEVIDQMQEECAELTKALSKIKRVMRGDKYVDPRKARENLVEELGDVEVMHTVLMQHLLSGEEAMTVCTTISEKTQRYYDRLRSNKGASD